MIEANTTDDVFRYVHIRSPKPLTRPGVEGREGTDRERAREAEDVIVDVAGPESLRSRNTEQADAASTRASTTTARADLRAVADELAALAVSSTPAGGSGRGDATLPESATNRLSADSRALLEHLDLDVAQTSLPAVLAAIESELRRRPHPVPDPPPPLQEEEERPYVRSVGVADLLVVKQHLKGYERTDIAHVENVLAGESRSRTHRALERVEETFTTERQTTSERETELETAERFELQKETTRTIEQDHRFGFGLTVSGRYGPSVEYSSNLSRESSTSSSETASAATTYAKDVMSRTLERVIEQVREERVLRMIREQEETNTHGFANPGPDHVTGVYQFLEKVYESQVFSYGMRQMLDVMIPEPASQLWWLEATPAQGLNLPTPPPRLSAYAASAEAITPDNYLEIAALYGVDGVAPPPPYFLLASASVNQGASGGDEEGQPRSIVEKEIPVPDGYLPWFALIIPLALTDDALTIGVSVGGASDVWEPGASEQVDVGSGHRLATTMLGLGLASTEAHVTGSALTVQLVAFETATFGATIQVHFLRTADALTRWRIKTYDVLAAAYDDAITRYDLRIAELKAAAENAARQATAFGSAPSQNAIVIREELRRQCISVLTRDRFDEPNGMRDTNPPSFDFPPAASRGAFARFFEQAIEWDQLQYVCYPYYWARKESWDTRLLREDMDPTFLEFLKSGSARVVLPVRPGFEVAVSAYLEKEIIWDGSGEPPDIESDTYLPIVTEIKERTGAGEGEVPVGEPWETRLPTPLVIVRQEEDLPRWEREDADGWVWREVESDDGAPSPNL